MEEPVRDDRSILGWLARRGMLAAAIAGGSALLAAWLLARTGHAGPLVSGLLVSSFVLCGGFALAKAWESLRKFDLDVNVMMVLGAGLAVVMHEPMEGALLLFLFTMAGGLETMATARAHRAVDELGNQFPAEAIVERDGVRHTVRVDDVATDERLIVRPGDRVACDGRVIEGQSHVNESAITGEFLPQEKHPGSDVFAGSLNGDSPLVVRVTHRASESTLARVARLVESARAEKTAVESTIERVGKWYGPSVLAVSILMLLVSRFLHADAWSAAVYRSITILIVASPCALMLASPVPILCAIADAARHGIVTKGGRYLEQLAAARTIYLDKTGTLTTGQVRLAGVDVLNGHDEDAILRTAFSLERDSTHPLAAAVLRRAHERQIEPVPLDNIRNQPGRGIVASHAGREVRLGRADWAAVLLPPDRQDTARRLVEESESRGRTPVVLAGDGAAGVLSFEDTLRPGAAGLVDALRQEGIEQVVLLTGDRRGVGQAMLHSVGLDEFHAELLPEDKLAKIDAAVRAGRGVVMVGDGVNDAPALARADVGIAMGGVGSHTALESSDFVLLHDRVDVLPYLIRLAHRTRRVMIQNIAFALAVIVVLVTWASFSGHPSLALGVVGHEGSTLIVVANGLRILGGAGRQRGGVQTRGAGGRRPVPA